MNPTAMSENWRVRLQDMLAVAVAMLATSLVVGLPPGWTWKALTVVAWAAGLALTGSYRPAAGLSLSGLAGRLAVDHAIITTAWWFGLGLAGVQPGYRAGGTFAGLAYVALVARRSRRPRPLSPAAEPRVLEIWRSGLLAAATAALVLPYFSPNLIGTFDGKLYGEAMQDFLGQVRAGIFPVFVSQTEIAPFGAVFPFRMAWYHFHFGALVELVTWRTLSPYAVQHATVVLSAFGGAGIMYAGLRNLIPDRPWEAVAVAFLYVSSPAWLGGLYAKDMIFTFMTLPWLALLGWAIARTLREPAGREVHVALGSSLAAAWLAHPPVGFWASVAVLLTQATRLATVPTGRRQLGGLALAAGLCVVLCGGLFVSLADVRVPGEYLDPSASIIANLRAVVPAVFRPVSAAADQLSDFQLGYALQVLLLLILALGADRTRWAFAGAAIVLLLLVYPVPGVTAPLWRFLPREIANITNVWPMQRIYPVAAALIAVGGFLALGGRKAAVWHSALLGALCLWSGAEAAKFVRRGFTVTKTAEATRLASRTENSPLLPNWTAYTPRLPDLPLVSRVTDPRLLNQVIGSPSVAEPESPAGTTTTLAAAPWDPGVLRVRPDLRLEPGQRYEVVLTAGPATPPGILQILTLDVHPRFYQEVEFPAADRLPTVLSLWTSGREMLEPALFFRPRDQARAAEALSDFAQAQIRPYAEERNGVRVTSLAPYRSTVDAGASGGLLETHRFFARGYRATVNGRDVAVVESPRHLVAIPVGPGRSEVTLDYPGPPMVRVGFWVTVYAWAGLLAWSGWSGWRKWRGRGSSPAKSPPPLPSPEESANESLST